jgi:hypothetical protein
MLGVKSSKIGRLARAGVRARMQAGVQAVLLASLGALGLWGVHGLMHTSGIALAAPEPDPVPKRWQLEIEPGPLRIASVLVGNDTRMYYYMTYKATNTSGQDQMFTPSFDMATDAGDVLRSGRDVPSDVTKAILASLEAPLIQDQIGVVGMLLQGEANAKEGLVVWPVVSSQVSSLTVFGNGFSGETRTIDAYDPETKGSKRVTLRKAYMMRFQPLGEVRASSESLPLIEKRWVLR